MVTRRLTICRAFVAQASLVAAASALLATFASAQDAFRANTPQKTTDPIAGEAAAQAPASAQPDSPDASQDDLELKTLTRNSAEATGDQQVADAKAKPFATGVSLWRPLLSLVLVIATILAATYLYRRYVLGQKQPSSIGHIRILAKSPVNSKQSLCLVKLDHRLILVGLSPNHMAALQTIDDPDEVARMTGLLESQSPQSISNTFSRLFNSEARTYNDDADLLNSPDAPDENARDQDMYSARGEVSNLLSKIKGLTRLHSRL